MALEPSHVSGLLCTCDPDDRGLQASLQPPQGIPESLRNELMKREKTSGLKYMGWGLLFLVPGGIVAFFAPVLSLLFLVFTFGFVAIGAYKYLFTPLPDGGKTHIIVASSFIQVLLESWFGQLLSHSRGHRAYCLIHPNLMTKLSLDDFEAAWKAHVAELREKEKLFPDHEYEISVSAVYAQVIPDPNRPNIASVTVPVKIQPKKDSGGSVVSYLPVLLVAYRLLLAQHGSRWYVAGPTVTGVTPSHGIPASPAWITD